MSPLSAQLQEIAALPADRPMSMPGAFYTSQEQFEREAATVLRRGWHCLGRADEVPNAGDFFTVQLLNEPLIVVRQTDGTVAVLANVCRHRGMPWLRVLATPSVLSVLTTLGPMIWTGALCGLRG